MRRLLAAAALAALCVTATSQAQEIDREIAGAESEAAGARARAADLARDLDALQAELRDVEGRVQVLTDALLAARQRQLVLEAQLAAARHTLARRANAAYQAGPGAAIEIFLAVRSPSELVSAQEYAERAFGTDADLIASIEQKQAQVEANRALLEERQVVLEREQSRVAELLEAITVRLAQAQSAVRSAEGRIADLKRRKAEIEAAARREAARQAALERARQLAEARDAATGTYTGGANWDAIAMCESSGNWAANTGNGYWGGLQFHPQTWSGYGGGPFDGKGPFPYSREQQIAVAERVLDSQGPGAWPNCFVPA